MAMNIQEILDNVINTASSENILNTGGNIFGARKPSYSGRLEELGLINAGDLEQAKRSSLYQGLLGAGLNYLATPKNKGFGSALPYLAQAGIAGVSAAQKPYDALGKEALMNSQLNTIGRTMDSEKARDKLFSTTPAQSVTVNSLNTSNLKPIEQMGPDGTSSPRPNFGENTSTTYNIPEKQNIDPDALRKYALQYPKEGGSDMYGILKAESEIAQNNRPDAASLEAKGKQWDKMVREGTTGKWENFAAFMADNTTKSGVEDGTSEIFKETVKGFQTTANSNRLVAQQIGVITDLLKGKEGGSIVQLSADAQQFLGLQTELTSVNQIVTALKTRGGVAVRAPGSGSTSDLEFNAYMKSFPDLSSTPNGRAMMQFVSNKSADRSAKLADKAMELWKQGKFSNVALAEYDASLGRLISKETEAKLKTLVDNTPNASPYAVYDPLMSEVDAIIANPN